MSELLLTAYDGAILGPIAKILGLLMSGIYNLMAAMGIENVGLTIIIFTIVMYMLMFPLTYKQQKFSKLSQKMQPEIQAIRKKYEGKKDQESVMAMNEETQMIYEKYGVSMTGSCGQLMIQMPILFALYRVFMNVPAYVGGVKEHFTGLVEHIMATEGFADKMAQLVVDFKIVGTTKIDFSATDPEVLSNFVIDVLNKLGTNGWASLSEVFPTLEAEIASTYATISKINALGPLNISDNPWEIIKDSFASGAFVVALVALMVPVLSYVFQILNMKMMPTASNNNAQDDAMAQQMNMMNKTMPLMSLFMCFSVPVGLGIYWVMSSVVRLVQQYFLNKHFEKINLDDIIKENEAKAKAKREQMGIAENQIRNAAKINTRRMEDRASVTANAEREALLERANAAKANAKPESMTAKANLVKEFNERNNKK